MPDSITAGRTPVHEFDFIADHALMEDVHKRYWQLKTDAPPVFWTNANGGHWVCNTGDTVLQVMRQPEIFSNRYLSIPPNPDQPKLIPEMLDPPEHRPYRQLMRPFFEMKAIAPLEKQVEEWTIKLLDEVAPAGECEFVADVASRLPIAIFMELFGFPMEKFDEFRRLVVQFMDSSNDAATRRALAQQVQGHLDGLIRERRAQPRDDMISKIITSRIDGRELTHEELMSIGFLMFLAGLDTVTNAMSFGMRHLAHDEALRQSVIDDPDGIPDLVEELLRRYAFVATPRYVTQDISLGGAELRAGDSILAPLALVGWEESSNPNPEEVRLDRPHRRHTAFGFGIHTCLGIFLARMELNVFYRTWFSRIGHFRQVRPEDAKQRGGHVMALEKLYLAWK